jgi:hypothetical protein
MRAHTATRSRSSAHARSSGQPCCFDPRALLEAATGEPVDEDVALYGRLLGARHLVEAAILWRWTTPMVVRAGAAIDVIHGASAVVSSQLGIIRASRR